MSIDEEFRAVRHTDDTCEVCGDLDMVDNYLDAAHSYEAHRALYRLRDVLVGWALDKRHHRG